MTDRFEAILDESISALQAGVSIEEILVEVPDYASELRPLLYAAMLLADPNPKLVPEERKAALQSKYLALAAQLSPIQPTFADKAQAVLSIIKKRFTPSAVINDLFTVSITIILTLIMAALVLSYLAKDSIPGDLLYGVKQISENAQLLLTRDKARRSEIEETFNQRRLDEINQLIEQERAAIVHFRGTLETKSENLWVIAGHTIFLPNDIHIQDDPQEGDEIEIIGLLRTNNVLVADTIRVVE